MLQNDFLFLLQEMAGKRIKDIERESCRKCLTERLGQHASELGWKGMGEIICVLAYSVSSKPLLSGVAFIGD